MNSLRDKRLIESGLARRTKRLEIDVRGEPNQLRVGRGRSDLPGSIGGRERRIREIREYHRGLPVQPRASRRAQRDPRHTQFPRRATPRPHPAWSGRTNREPVRVLQSPCSVLNSCHRFDFDRRLDHAILKTRRSERVRDRSLALCPSPGPRSLRRSAMITGCRCGSGRMHRKHSAPKATRRSLEANRPRRGVNPAHASRNGSSERLGTNSVAARRYASCHRE